ncbi:MAG: VOC family protein [Flavobacteriaceae bacterium]|nr:VOC family protein [Flavobacteriaceae bacterium]
MNIHKLTLYGSNITALASFYREILGLTIIKKTAINIQLKIGNSILSFTYRKNAIPYHFAINIPANKASEALIWLKTKVEILKNNGQEIQDFQNWNAEAIYFYDADQNIVELIARKNLDNNSDKKFDTDSFLEISEIGIVTKDIKKIFIQLTEKTSIDIYSGNFTSFCAIGDEQALFICMNKKYWFPTEQCAYPADFITEIVVNGKEFKLAFINGEIRLG